jgi:hypothetical protein
MPRYHFVVRAPDHTHDDPDGTHFPNHDTAREHGHRIVRELADGGYKPGNAVLLVQDETQSTRSRFEQSHDCPRLTRVVGSDEGRTWPQSFGVL